MRSDHRANADRVRVAGTGALSDVEVVTTLVGSAEKASELMASYGDLPALGRADITDLEQRVGRTKAITLAAALEVGRRALSPRHKGMAVRVSDDVFRFYAARLQHLSHEVFHVLCLDTKHRVLQDARVVEGGLTTCSVLPREAFAPAIRVGATAVVMVHNHPSGDPNPSADDLALTARLKQARAVLGIRLLDHVIVGDGKYVSLADEGQLAAL